MKSFTKVALLAAMLSTVAVPVCSAVELETEANSKVAFYAIAAVLGTYTIYKVGSWFVSKSDETKTGDTKTGDTKVELKDVDLKSIEAKLKDNVKVINLIEDGYLNKAAKKLQVSSKALKAYLNK